MAAKTISWMEVEMLYALHHLRYLTTEQIHSVWFAGRTLHSCRWRLCRLREASILDRVSVPQLGTWGCAWRVDKGGRRRLRASKQRHFVGDQPLTVTLIPHQLEVNQVFLDLADGEPVWGRLPFSWSSSNRNAFHFEQRRRDDFGVLRTRNARLIPDALIVPTSPAGPRVFLELDRSTECVREADGRRSVRSKLRAYQIFLTTGDWYAQAFNDDRPARVVFVLSRQDLNSRDPAERDRRKRSIKTEARKVAPHIDLHTVYLDEVHELRAACGLATRVAPPPRCRRIVPPTRARWTHDDFVALNALHRAVSQLYPDLEPEMQERIIRPANAARRVLARIHASLAHASEGRSSGARSDGRGGAASDASLAAGAFADASDAPEEMH
jgi:hypothetical protein